MSFVVNGLWILQESLVLVVVNRFMYCILKGDILLESTEREREHDSG